MKALEVGFGTANGSTALGGHFRSLMWQLGVVAKHGELKSTSEVGGTGKSPSHVFPLPPMSKGGNFLTGKNVKSSRDKMCQAGGNVIVACLNWMHGGQRQRDHMPVLSAAHRRVHSRIEGALEAMVMTDELILTNSGLDQFLRQSKFYTGEGVSLALGVRGGVPEKAADVSLADHLSEHFPVMAKQVVRPDCLLLPSRRRPRRVKRGYTWLAPTYPELVKRNIQAGLHRYKKASQVARHRGVKCLAGAFAVKKDSVEDRVITDPSVNQLLDPEKLPRPKFAYIPSLRCLTVPSEGIVAVSKRDARHYFHRLRIGKNWHRWLCGPPVEVSGRGGSRRLYPASCSAPMGFGPSAGWAQGLTDVVAIDAQLPQDCRVHPDFVIPESLPVWGSIIDDIWALEHVPGDEVASIGPAWLQQAETAWTVRGVAPNTKKSVDGAHGEEIQGYFVHPTRHWVGLSYEKRRFLFQASFKVLMQRRTHLKVIERLIGKHGFLHSCRPCMRSVFGATYGWLETARKERPGPVVLPSEVWVELLVSTMLIPFAEFNLSSGWSTRVEATDASMSGLGRSFGYVPEYVVKVIVDLFNVSITNMILKCQIISIRGLVHAMFPTHGLSRVQNFLLASLKSSTAEKYMEALRSLNNSLLEAHLQWNQMNEEEQDVFLAEWVLDGYENGDGRNAYSWALSAVQKIFPRVKLKTAWKVMDVWGCLVPVRQAPAAPPELIQAMVVMATILNKPHLGMLILLCFVGLLRVREALSLRMTDLVVQPTFVVLCLGVTKRGMEQKVVLNNFTVVQFVADFLKRFPCKHSNEHILQISYSSSLRWIRKLGSMLGAGDLGLTTHSFRRSGASELARQGMGLPDILLYGRWLSERSAREYIRRGEVAIYRARQLLKPHELLRIQNWANIGLRCWEWYDVFYKHGAIAVDVRKLTLDKLTHALKTWRTMWSGYFQAVVVACGDRETAAIIDRVVNTDVYMKVLQNQALSPSAKEWHWKLELMQLSYNPVFANIARRMASIREAPVVSHSGSLRPDRRQSGGRRSSGAGIMFLTEALA
eukprot:s430_g10.t1